MIFLNKELLLELKKKISELSEFERDLLSISYYKTGKPSVDMPWLQYYNLEQLTANIPMVSAYHQIIDKNKDNLNNTAIIYGDKEITYSEVFKKINIVASAFQKLGIHKGSIVSVCIANIPEVAYIFYALNKIGAICDFMDPRATENVMKQHLELAKSNILLTISDCYPLFKNLKNQTEINSIISIDPTESLNIPQHEIKLDENDYNWKEFFKLGNEFEIIKVDDDISSPVTILHTGGSTGEPKGALLSNYNLNALATQWLSSGIEYKKGAKILSLMPPFVSFGLAANLHVPFCNSMQVIMIPKYEPEKTLDIIEMYKPNVVPASPAHWESVYLDPRSFKRDWSHLDVALMGGDILNPKVESGLNELFEKNGSKAKFTVAYGMTETATAIAFAPNKQCNKDTSVGIPLPKTNIAIINPSNEEELGYNEIGEIYVSTPNHMIGYYYKDDETKKTLRIGNNNDIWVKTGDLGFMTEDGILYVKGRIKRLIIRYDGTKIYAGEVEAKISKNELVKKCAVVGAEDMEHFHGENAIAYIVLNENMANNNCYDIIRDYCNENIIDYEVPVDFQFIDDLPYTRNGKVDYKLLKEQYSKKQYNSIIKKLSKKN